jgi:ubiquitin-like-conjugating enzyme ATG3
MSVLGSLRAAREWAMPTLTHSQFLEKGVLTPEEFVKAGDELVYKCPTWAWEGGEASKRKSYLPPNKQYLITRNVPCQNRVSSMETALSMQLEAGGEEGDEEWLVSSIIKASDNPEDEFDILDSEGEVIETPSKPAADAGSSNDAQAAAGSQDDDEYADMADFEDDNVLEDDAAAVSASPGDNDNLIKVRTYDLSITYDKYYQTPRVWMIGVGATGQPLTANEMMEDVISDYANKTVTMENHPHVSGHHASIHPCQHGKVMKAIVKNLIRASEKKVADGQQDAESAVAVGPSVEMYIFIFLKFVSSMIPTINYDFTMDVTADTSK